MKKQINLIIILLLAIFFAACSSDDSPSEEPEETTIDPFSVLATIDDAYYLAPTESLDEETLSFINNGTQLDADQAARIIGSGGYIYSLNYGTGLLSQLELNEDGSYDVVKEINAGLSVGTDTPRYKLADNNTIMVYNVVTDYVYNDLDDQILHWIQDLPFEKLIGEEYYMIHGTYQDDSVYMLEEYYKP